MLVSGISFLCLFVNLILAQVPPSPGSPIPSPITSSFSDSPLCTSITPSLFHSRLKTYLFHKSYPLNFTSSSRTASTDLCLHRFSWATRFLILIFSLFFVSGPCARLSWPSRLVNLLYRIVSYHKHCKHQQHHISHQWRAPCINGLLPYRQCVDRVYSHWLFSELSGSQC